MLSITWKNLLKESSKASAKIVPNIKYNIPADLVEIYEINNSNSECQIVPKLDLTTTHPNDWISSHFLIKTKAEKEVLMESVGVKVICSEAMPQVLLGELKVCESQESFLSHQNCCLKGM